MQPTLSTDRCALYVVDLFLRNFVQVARLHASTDLRTETVVIFVVILIPSSSTLRFCVVKYRLFQYSATSNFRKLVGYINQFMRAFLDFGSG